MEKKECKLFSVAAICLLGLSLAAYSQKTPEKETGQDSTSIFSEPIPLGEVKVSSLRISREVKEVPASMVVVKPYDYQKQSALSLSSVLDREPGITAGGDGVWATNVNIRGIGENRLVSLIDGNRVETATDLTASLSMVDVHDIECVEIIKGAQSSLYGTGAMGGIVNIITKDGHFAGRPYFSGNVISGFASANTLFSNHAALKTGSGRWYLRVSGARSDADDMRTPEGELPNSQYTMNNIAARAGVKPFANHLFKIQYQRNWSTDVGIPGGDAFPGPAEATYTDISRDLLSASYEINDISDRLASIRLNYFTQNIHRANAASFSFDTGADQFLPADIGLSVFRAATSNPYYEREAFFPSAFCHVDGDGELDIVGNTLWIENQYYMEDYGFKLVDHNERETEIGREDIHTFAFRREET